MKTLQLYVGVRGDNQVYNTNTALPGAYTGIVNVGPHKLIQFLELHLGLSGIFPTSQERVLDLKLALENVKDQPAFHFKASFENDPLGVSERLLQLWDSWRLSGWTPHESKGAPSRMKMLAAYADLFYKAGAGEPDRVLALIDIIGNGDELPPITIKLVDDIDLFPHLYQVLLKKLQGLVEKEISSSPGVPETDLDKLKHILSGGKLKPDQRKLKNDGSLVIINFPDDIQAASAIFSIQNKIKWNPLMVNADTGLLNGLSLRQNKPVCNWQLSGGNGQVLQLFFLATAMFKRPLQATEVIAFLSASYLPFPKSLGRNLIEIFSAKPGISPEWKKCIEDFMAESKLENKSQAKAINFWLQNRNILKEGSYSIGLIKEIYLTLQQWAAQAAHYKIDAISQMQFMQLAYLCSNLISSIEHDALVISDAKLDRLQFQLFFNSGYTIMDAQIGCDNLITEPANVWTTSHETLWVNAMRKDSSSLSSTWFTAEKKFLITKGYAVPDNSTEYSIESNGIKRMINNTMNRLVIVMPAKYHGEIAYTPYCLDEWKEHLDLSAVTINCRGLISNVPWHPNTSLLTDYTKLGFPEPTEYISIPDNKVYTRESESYTSLEKLIQHPLQWFFEYQLFLRHKAGISFPDESSLRGTIADVIVQKLFTVDSTNQEWWQNDIKFEAKILAELKQVLDEQGVVFLEDGFKRSLIEYRKLLCRNLIKLKEIIIENKFEIEGTQHHVEGSLNGQKIAGDIDLLLKKGGRFFIIDLKWALSSNSYVVRIQEGKDLQLALYESMLPKTDASAYYLLNDGKLLIRESGLNLNGRGVEYIPGDAGISAVGTCMRASNSMKFRHEEFAKGKIETAYGTALEQSEIVYEADEENSNLYPLYKDDDGHKKQPYTSDLNLFLGKII